MGESRAISTLIYLTCNIYWYFPSERETFGLGLEFNSIEKIRLLIKMFPFGYSVTTLAPSLRLCRTPPWLRRQNPRLCSYSTGSSPLLRLRRHKSQWLHLFPQRALRSLYLPVRKKNSSPLINLHRFNVSHRFDQRPLLAGPQ